MIDCLLFTDGGYSSSRNKMGIGIAFVNKNTHKKIIEYSNSYERGTNNKAELIAVIVGLRMIKKELSSLTIVTDSEYVRGCASLGWKRTKNIVLWKEFDKQYKRVQKLCPNIIFEHTDGHQKDDSEYTKWNNYVDKLAQNATHWI